jgi:hypothetical protein
MLRYHNQALRLNSDFSTSVTLAQRKKGKRVVEDLDINLVAWPKLQMQAEIPRQCRTGTDSSLGCLLRWRRCGRDSTGIQVLVPRVDSLTDAWIRWLFTHLDRSERTAFVTVVFLFSTAHYRWYQSYICYLMI